MTLRRLANPWESFYVDDSTSLGVVYDPLPKPAVPLISVQDGNAPKGTEFMSHRC